MIAKKFLSAIAAVTIVFSAVACGSPATETFDNANITIAGTSSEYAQYLENKLPTMPDSLTLATGESAMEYGIDIDSFVSDDGFTIRASNGEVVILAKNDAGIDRAVRHLVNYGNIDSYNYTYGEGYRVGSLTIAGNDISEYVVIRDDDADECQTFAASELVTYIEKTCGVTIPSFTVSEYAAAVGAPSRTITLTVDYPALGDEAFTIDVGGDGNLTISGGRFRGCMYGVYDLLRDIGWRFTADALGNYVEYLYEANNVNLTSDINRTEEASMRDRKIYDGGEIHPNVNNLAAKLFINPPDGMQTKHGPFGLCVTACHGLQANAGIFKDYYDFAMEGTQPCFTDENILQCIEDYCRDYVESRLAAGMKIGREISCIDISQFDCSDFCYCDSCSEIVERDGSVTGVVLEMTNRMADVVMEYCDKDKGEVIYVSMLAYAGTNNPPLVTRPRDNVKISYCFYFDYYVPCSNHSLSGEGCSQGGYTIPGNKALATEFKRWVEIVPEGCLQVWYYPLNAYQIAFQPNIFDIIYDDFRFFAENGADGLMMCGGYANGLVNHSFPGYLCALMAWDADMTRDEFEEYMKEWYLICYGDAGEYIYEYFELCDAASDHTGCWCAFRIGPQNAPKMMVNHFYFANNFDYMWDIFNYSRDIAETSYKAELVERCMGGMLYMGIGCSHTDRYINGTEEERAIICERYDELCRIFRKYELPHTEYGISNMYYVPDYVPYGQNPFDFMVGG